MVAIATEKLANSSGSSRNDVKSELAVPMRRNAKNSTSVHLQLFFNCLDSSVWIVRHLVFMIRRELNMQQIYCM
jgi:hypothetical protein